MKKIFLLLLSVSVAFVGGGSAKASVSTKMLSADVHPLTMQDPDTVARDLSDLEDVIPTSATTQAQDTAYYGAARQKNFNALRFVLDSRHRFKGDRYVRGDFWNNTFIDMGGGVGGFYHNTNAASFTPTLSLRLGVGKVVSPMVSFRLGFEKAWAYSHASTTVYNTNQYNSYGGYVDFLYNFSNYLLGYRPERPFNVSGILGLGVQTASLHSWNNADMTAVGASTSGAALDGHVGVQFKFFASPYASIVLEPYFKVATKKLNLLANPGYSDPDFSYGVNFAYQWNFAKQLSYMANAGIFQKHFNNQKRYMLDNGQLQHLRYPMFFDYSFGPMYVGKSYNLSLRNTRGFDALAAVGWWLAPAAGVRAGVHVTNGDWKQGSIGNDDTKSLIGTRGVNVDFLFNPFGFKRHYNWDAPVGMNLLAGYEFGGMKKTAASLLGSYEGNYTAFRFGGQLWMKLTNDLRLTLEPTYMQIEHYNGNLDRERYDEYAVKLGLSLLFRDKGIRNYRNVESDSVLNTVERGYFLGLGLGWNNTVWDWRFKGYQHDLLKNVVLFGGYRFNKIHGIRLQAEWMKEAQAFFDSSGSGIEKFTYNNYLLSTDYQINLFNAMAGYDPLRRWNVYMYAGPTLLLGDGGAAFAANVGGMVTYNITPNLSLFYSHTIYRMPKTRYPHHMVYTRDGIFTNNLNVGIMYNFDRDNNIFAAASQRRFFFEYGFGPAYTGRTPLRFRNTRGFDANASIGWWFSSAFALRGGVHVTNADWQTTQYANEDTKLLVGTRGIAADLLINPLGFVKDYNWEMPFGFNLVGGYEFGQGKRTMTPYADSFEGNYTALRGGVQLWARLANGLRFTLEPMVSSVKLKGVNGYNYNEYALKAGVAVLFKRQAERNYPDVPSDEVRNIPKKGYFLGVGMGWSNTIWDWRFSGYQHGVLKNATIFGGYHFNELHGIRLQSEWMREKIAFPNYASQVKLKPNNYLLSFDYQFNLYNYMAGYDPSCRWNVYLYGGPTLAVGDGGTKLAANVGGMVTYNLTPDVSLFYSHTIYRFNKHYYPTSLVYTRDGTYTNNLNVGIMYNFDRDNNIFAAASQRRFFFEYGFGPAYTGRTPLRFRNTRGFDANASIGWWFSSAFALRGGVHVTNADWQTTQYANEDTKLLVGTRGIAADLLINPLGFVKDYNWEMPFGFNLVGGYEFGQGKRTMTPYADSFEGNYTALRGGVQLWARLANGLRFTLEPMVSSVKLKGVNGYNYNEYALKAGVAVLFKRQAERNYPDVPSDEVRNIPKKGYFLGVGMGWSNTIWDWRFSGYQHGVLKNATIFGGYHFNELHGIRLQSEWMREKIAFPNYASQVKLKPNNYLLSFDYQFNLYNYMAGYDPSCRWNVYLYGGPTLAVGDGGTKLAANVGGMVTYNLTPDVSLFYSHTIYRFNKHYYPTSLVYTRDGTYTNNLNIGVMYSFDAFRNFLIRDDEGNPMRRPLFLEYGIGPTFMSKTPLKGFKTTGFDSKFLVGWWANSAVGVRGGAHVTNANWDKGSFMGDDVTLLIGTRGALFDLLINPLGFVSHYDWNSPLGFNVFGGYEIGHAKKTSAGFVNTFEGNYHTFRVGGQLWAKLTNDLRLTFEPTFSAIKLSASDDNRHNQFALNVGVSMLMRSKKFRDYDETLPEEKRYNLPLQGFFVGGGFGWNNTIWRWKFSSQKGDLLKNAMAFAGYNFSTVHGVRVQGEWMREKMDNNEGAGIYTEHFNNVLVSFDYQLNALNAISGFDPARRWNVYFYGGPTMLMGTGGFKGALNVGGQVGYSINRNLSLFYSHTVYRMPDGRYPHSQPFTKNGTFTNNLNIGLMYNFK
ncbi:outer membrane beta-barrel protein [Segatella salivae]|uniref:outer membrane beta-barrel protein n=1 Tax=Segatella salivae TaxID=228604 RepID=UPI00241D14D3|nr:outer membrane beta-barrel protein [Segatella salivae]